VKNHSKSSIPNLLGLQKTVENQATYFWWNMQGDTLEPSTYFLLGIQKQHHTLKIQHLTSVGYAKTTLENQALTSVGYAKKKHLKIKHLLLLLGMPETPEIHNNLRQLGYLFLQQLPKQTNKQSFNTNRKQKSLSLCCSLHTFCVI